MTDHFKVGDVLKLQGHTSLLVVAKAQEIRNDDAAMRRFRVPVTTRCTGLRDHIEQNMNNVGGEMMIEDIRSLWP